MYSISYPSGTLRKDGVVFTQNINDPEYQTYELWLSENNGPEVIQEPIVNPRIIVSAWQIRKALNLTQLNEWTTLRQAVESAVSQSSDQALKDGWNHSPTFRSDEPLTLQMGLALGKNTEDMYILFKFAESL